MPGGLLHVFPLSTLSCSQAERHENNEEDKKGTGNDRQLLPDMLGTEIQKDRELVGCC